MDVLVSERNGVWRVVRLRFVEGGERMEEEGAMGRGAGEQRHVLVDL